MHVMRRIRLIFPILLALPAAACSGQQASFLTVSNPQAGEIEERGLFTGDGPFAGRRSAPAYAQPGQIQQPPPPQPTYAAQAYPQPQVQQPYAQQPYAPPAPAQHQVAAARGQVVEQRYGPNSYVMQYQPPPQPVGGPYAAPPYGYAYAYPPPQKPSPLY
jgi:hypothetical protein